MFSDYKIISCFDYITSHPAVFGASESRALFVVDCFVAKTIDHKISLCLAHSHSRLIFILDEPWTLHI